MIQPAADRSEQGVSTTEPSCRFATEHPTRGRTGRLIKLSISPLYVLIGAPSIRCADIAEAAIMFP